MPTPEEALLAKSLVTTIETISPKGGSYQITPIRVGSDYVAIAPLTIKKEGSIIVPDDQPTTGIVVGIGPTTPQDWRDAFRVGDTVKYFGQPICNLDGLFPFYGKARVILVRYTSILVALAGESVHMIGIDRAKS